MNKWIKNLFITSFILGSFFGCSRNSDKNTVKIIPDYGTEYNLSKKEAESQMYNLSKNPDTKEDAWAYIKDKLFDIGEGETKDSVKINKDYLSNLIKKEKPDTVYYYHVHPKIEGKIINPPSSKDIKVHANLKKQFADKGLHLVSRVFDGYGVWTYDIDTLNSKRFFNTNDSLILSFRYKALDYQMNAWMHDLLKNQKHLSLEEKVSNFIEYSKKLEVEIKFEFME